MEDEDFVADSDEDEQEMMDTLAVAEERLTRQRLEAADRQEVADFQEESKEQEQAQTTAVVTPEQQQTVETVEEQQETDGEEQEEDGVLEVGTFVEVESRTWPGINKQGGAGHVTRMHREQTEGGEEEIFYDVRYVLGGFERHIEREFVHSSALLQKHSDRKKVGREYYHDDYINKPHQRKQKELEERRERMMARPELAEVQGRKRKRPHRSTRAERIHDKPVQSVRHSEDEAGERRSKVPKIDDQMFVLTEANSSLEASTRPPSDSEKTPVKPAASQRRRHRILDSSDEESSDSGETGDNPSHSPDLPEHLERTDALVNESLITDDSAQVSRENPANQPPKRKRKKHKSSRRRFIGGYEHNEEDADGMFIQPEGDPAELPEDVIRETGLRLATSKEGLMKQLQEIFTQQQKNIADFHEEQKIVDQKMKDLSGMPFNGLLDLHRKVFDLDKIILTKTLVNAGEDAMNTISRKLERRGKLPIAFVPLDNAISEWKEELKECARWVRHVTNAVEDAFARRNENIPIVQVARAEYSSDSSYSADDYDTGDLPEETAGIDAPADDIDFSFDYEPESVSNRGYQKRQRDRVLKDGAPRSNASITLKQTNRKKIITTTTLDDYFPRQGSSKGFRSNFRLFGRQKKILPSDPRWNWVRIARKKQQHTGNGTRERSTGPPSFGISNGYGSVHAVHEVRSTNVSSRDDSFSVQTQQMHLRDKIFRSQPTPHRSHESFVAQSASQPVRNSSRAVYPAGISFDDVAPEKRLRPAEPVNSTTLPSNFKHHSIDWEAVFEVVSDDPASFSDGDNISAISRDGQELLLAFGYPICGTLAPPHLFSDEEWDLGYSESFRAVVTRRVARLRQLLNDLRLQESSFMDTLSRGGLGAIDGEGYANALEWGLLVSLEDAYHKAIASFSAQLLEALKGVSPTVWPNYLKTVLEEIAALIRQLPDCDSLFSGCKAYFFFFEVASRDAATTPLLTAVSRTYWYCLNLLVALQPISDVFAGSHATTKQEVEDTFRRTLPVNSVILAVVLFLFDLNMYLPSSHRLGPDGLPNGPLPALSLWMLIRGYCTSRGGVDQADQESLSTKEKHLWALLQAVYRQRYFDELARFFVRNESCGGYLRDFGPNTTDSGKTEDCDEVFESQLLALEATWDLLAVLTRIYTGADSDTNEEAISDAKWALVKDLLQPGKRDFLPFNLPPSSTYLQSDYRHRADLYKHHVLTRVMAFSKLWRPSKEVIELVLRQLWDNDASHHTEDITELPQFLKQFISRCKELGNSRLRLAEFAGEDDDDGDSTTALCKIIWIQLLRLEKRVHRSRFRRSVLNSIPNTPDNQQTPPGLAPSAFSHETVQKKSGIWDWGPKQHAPANIQPAKPPGLTRQRSPACSGVGKEQMSTAVLLTFAVVGVCLECGDEQQFPVKRPDKDVRYMEREVDFYCKEILRWTSGKPACEVLAAQALFTLGALLLEKNSTEFPTIFGGLNDRLVSSMKNLQANPFVSPTSKQSAGTTVNTTKAHKHEEKRRQLFQSAAMSPLYQIRDLIRKVLAIPSSGICVGPAYGAAVEKSLEHIFGAGMEACLNGVIQKFVTVKDLKIAMEIFQLVLPRVPDEPKQCLALSSTPKGEFDDDFDDALANIDMEDVLSGHSSTPAPAWTVTKCRSKVVQLITGNLRVTVQQLALNYPPSDVPTFDELYTIDLLGMMISTCKVQFFWNNLMSTSAKSRNLAPRVLSAALKYNPEKEWLSNVFPRESRADHELSTAWLLGTLDVSTLNTDLIVFRMEDVSFGMGQKLAQLAPTHGQGRMRDSDYWAILTDGIIYHLLRENSLGLGAMDPHVLKLLREVASTCKFPSLVRDNISGLQDVAILYDLHLDVFQSFCKSAGTSWKLSRSSNWQKMNQFRFKMLNPKSGIFVSFLEAYKINFRQACCEIDQMNHDWHAFAKLFLRQAGVNATGGCSYHEMDDTIKSFDKRLTGLTTMFRFMYQCMDAFMFYCGEMAIGDTNLFFDAIGMLFRQVNSAEYPQAIKRLDDQGLTKRSGVRNVNVELRKDICPAAISFVDSVQLFFARQKYPSLLHWFAQTSDTYQTFKTGWSSSPLRTLLVNILDPDGPLGIHSYYPDSKVSNDSCLDIDAKTVRREAFYLSCGFFNCRCTTSFEHSRAQPALISCKRLQLLREFVLGDFMRETFSFALQEDTISVLETMVPMCQFVRAVLNHANLNVHIPSATQVDENGAESSVDNLVHHDFQLNELYPCLEWMVECMIKLIPGEEAVNSTICCVLLTELCGIVCEAITFNDHRPMLELIDLVELVLSYLQTVFVALSKRTTASISTLFVSSIELPLNVKLSAYRFSPSAFRDIVVDERFSRVSGRQLDSYGVSLARAGTDLLAAIGRVAHQCKASSDERLQGFTTISS